MSPLQEFLELATAIKPENRYRTVYDTDFSVLLPGKEEIDADLLETYSRIHFAGHSVVDLGCNFGFFSFQARRLGAVRVVGVDRQGQVLRGCELLSQHYGIDHVSFECHDIEDPACTMSGCSFDIAMMVEFFGKSFVTENRVASNLAFLERLSQRELIVSLQKIYWIRKDLGTTAKRLREIYPAKYITDGDFLLLDFVRDYFAPRWRMELLSPVTDGYEKPRKFLRFVPA
ncbi:MAG: class I SAM-dependent methyltransferase [Solidesulfovibrio sp.]